MHLIVAKAFFDMSGACKVDITGKADKADYDMSGACTIKAADWPCKVVSADCSGAGKLELNVSERLNIDASGMSTVTYKGRPTVHLETSGMSKVKYVD
jgi:hypothetical protein